MYVEAAGLRQHRAQLGQRQRAAQHQQTREDPDPNHETRLGHALGDQTGPTKMPEPMTAPTRSAAPSNSVSRRGSSVKPADYIRPPVQPAGTGGLAEATTQIPEGN